MKRLATAPHRLYFFLGAVSVFILFFWWWLQLQHPHTMAIPLHALLMPLGVFPLFILGFTFTAGPKWLAVSADDDYFLLHGATYFCGLLLAMLAASLGLSPLRGSGFALMLCAWLAVTWRWAGLIKRSTVPDKKHAIAILLAMCGGACALAATFLWSSGWEYAWTIARQCAFFGFLLPVFLTVCHRMLPFFSGNIIKPYVVWRPYWLLVAWLCGCALLVISGSQQWQWLEAGTATVMSLSFMYTSWRWGLLRSMENRLLAMLHLSFAWLAIVFALQAAGAFGVAVGSAPVHALALGFMGTMLVAFVSRVTYGHSGRPLHASGLLWGIYLGLHIAALLRILGSLLSYSFLITVSATVWLALLACWVGMMLPIYLRARADGQAG